MPCLTLILLLVVSPSLDAEFLRVEVAFQDTGCVSCIASLEGRLGRVRGMEKVEIDPDRGVAIMYLAPKNRVRLTPLLARITQDGTKILGTKVEARGVIESLQQGLTFTPSGINQVWFSSPIVGRIRNMRNEPERLLGEAPAFLGVLEAVSQIAPLEKPVLIVGERGTGKELIAERLHFLSNRWEGHYLKMNCAAIADSLLESELFGHEAGAFTGASRTHQGRFERAHGGTLFLDELANTSGLVQEKLLRVIEYGEFERVGGKKTLQCDRRLWRQPGIDREILP